MFGIPSEPQYLVNDNEGQSSHPLHQSEYSMLSALLISMQIWGKSARMLTSGEYTNSLPWDQNSTYSRILKDMDNWYNRLPERLKWSTMKLTAYRQLNLDIVSAALLRHSSRLRKSLTHVRVVVRLSIRCMPSFTCRTWSSGEATFR